MKNFSDSNIIKANCHMLLFKISDNLAYQSLLYLGYREWTVNKREKPGNQHDYA